MSVKLMTAVWENGPANSSQRFVLLAIADHAGDDGRNAYPSIETLARKTALSERTVMRAIDGLIASGYLLRTRRRDVSNMYQVVLERLQPAAPVSDKLSLTVGDNLSLSEVTLCHPVSDNLSPCNVTPCHPVGDTVSPDPSFNHPINRPINRQGEKNAPAPVAPVVKREVIDRTPGGPQAGEGYRPPPDRPIPESEPAMVTAAPLAVRLIWRITSNWPAADLHDWLAAEMGDAPDEDTFRRVYLAWRARGYKATNYEGLVEWYKAARANPNWQPPAQGRGGMKHDPDAREAHNRAVLGQVAQELSGGDWTPWIAPSNT